jgi:pSer/pThr/pTyr-binding forkhead associated (FHA) protein
MDNAQNLPSEPRTNEAASSVVLLCPKCSLPYARGTRVCARCGKLLINNADTYPLSLPKKTGQDLGQHLGKVFLESIKRITLEIGEQSIALPQQKQIIVGRSTPNPGIEQPDVTLNEFGAVDKGVSRRHIAITCKANLVYVSDLGSTNGTWLNGNRLFPHSERLMRAGDTLQLGELRMVVRF